MLFRFDDGSNGKWHCACARNRKGEMKVHVIFFRGSVPFWACYLYPVCIMSWMGLMTAGVIDKLIFCRASVVHECVPCSATGFNLWRINSHSVELFVFLRVESVSPHFVYFMVLLSVYTCFLQLLEWCYQKCLQTRENIVKCQSERRLFFAILWQRREGGDDTCDFSEEVMYSDFF